MEHHGIRSKCDSDYPAFHFVSTRLLALYNKNEMNDLTPEQRNILKDLLKHELEVRRHK